MLCSSKEFEVPVKDQQDDMQPEETTDTPPETMEEIEDAPPVRSAADDFEDEAVVEVRKKLSGLDTQVVEIMPTSHGAGYKSNYKKSRCKLLLVRHV